MVNTRYSPKFSAASLADGDCAYHSKQSAILSSAYRRPIMSRYPRQPSMAESAAQTNGRGRFELWKGKRAAFCGRWVFGSTTRLQQTLSGTIDACGTATVQALCRTCS